MSEDHAILPQEGKMDSARILTIVQMSKELRRTLNHLVGNSRTEKNECDYVFCTYPEPQHTQAWRQRWMHAVNRTQWDQASERSSWLSQQPSANVGPSPACPWGWKPLVKPMQMSGLVNCNIFHCKLMQWLSNLYAHVFCWVFACYLPWIISFGH